MAVDLKREQFNVVKIFEDEGSSGQKPNGVEPLDPTSSKDGEDEKEKNKDKSSGDSDEGSSGQKPNDVEPLDPTSSKDGSSGDSDDSAGDKADKGKLIQSRGPGAMLSEEESGRLVKEAGLEQGKKVEANDILNEADRAINSLESHRKTMGHGAGGSLRKRLAELNIPQVDWKSVLKRYIGNLMSKMEEYFGNRKFLGGGDYLYGDRPKYDAVNRCVIAIDVSGSVAGDEDFKEFVSEVSGIAYAKNIQEIHILPFAEKVKDDFIIKRKKPELSDFDNVRRGGGTEAIPDVISHINSIRGGVSFVVIITDGYLTSGLPQPPRGWGQRCIWLIYENPTFEKDFGFVPQWGKTIHCKFDRKKK